MHAEMYGEFEKKKVFVRLCLKSGTEVKEGGRQRKAKGRHENFFRNYVVTVTI